MPWARARTDLAFSSKDGLLSAILPCGVSERPELFCASLSFQLLCSTAAASSWSWRSSSAFCGFLLLNILPDLAFESLGGFSFFSRGVDDLPGMSLRLCWFQVFTVAKLRVT